MAWYHWIGTYTIILSAVALWAIPLKPIWLIICLILAIVLGVGSIMFLPEKEDEYFKESK